MKEPGAWRHPPDSVSKEGTVHSTDTRGAILRKLYTLIVRPQTPQQPHHLHIALALGFRSPRRPHL
jgi:hypothetical protein